MPLFRSLAQGAALVAALYACPLVAQAADVEPYEEFAQHLRAAQQVTPLTSTEFGDQTSLYNASTEFDVTDIDVPGNNALPVRLGRRFEIADWRGQGGHVGGFGEWDMDVPYLEGVFLGELGWQVASANPYDRCTEAAVPNTNSPTEGTIATDLVWDGYQMYMPGSGSQELLVNSQSQLPQVTDGNTYPWITKNYTRITCLPTTANGYPGEAFLAVSPDGVKTYFNWAVVKFYPTLIWKTGMIQVSGGWQPVQNTVTRSKIFMLATRTEDRFGNWVNYAYGTDATGNTILTAITSSDGRWITPTSTNGVITSATSSVGNWAYGYVTDPSLAYFNHLSLNTVTRPDGSQWTYTASGTLVSTKQPPDDAPPPTFLCQIDPAPNTVNPQLANGFGFTYTVGAPFGAVATYQFNYDRHYRSYVPYGCPKDPDPYHQYPSTVFDFVDNFSIHSKQVTGPGLVPQTWTYSETYPATETNNYYYVTSILPPDYNPISQTYVPPADCTYCNVSKLVTVVGPTHTDKYTFGVEYARNEGRLLASETDAPNGTVLKTTSNTYLPDSAVAAQAFPGFVGGNLAGYWKNPMTAWIRPVQQAATVQDGVTFASTTNSWDVFANPASVTRSSSLGYSKTDSTAYATNTTNWVIDQVASVTDVGSGLVMTQNAYDPTSAMLTSTQSFGLLQKTLTYNTDGTLKTVADGDNHTTTLANFYRGVPQSVTFADGTNEAAVVNGAGWITSLTEPIGATPVDTTTTATTTYGYDPMGRINQITYPTGDAVAWAPTTITFSQVTTPEYGLPAGHWTQTVSTGPAPTVQVQPAIICVSCGGGGSSGPSSGPVSVTYFDALLRPVLTQEYDAATPATTTRFTAKGFDADDHATYSSYPVAAFGTYPATPITPSSGALPGTYTIYDGLGRPTSSVQDSELTTLNQYSLPGQLTTSYAYLTGFQTRVTNPRGRIGDFSTTTSYQVFDSPDTSHPVTIASPLGVTTSITRDVFGKPLTLTRSGTWNSAPISQTRSYVYDANQRLCKRVEPETGATLMNYDGANNVLWTATGSALTSTATCDNATKPANAIARSYDLRNRPLTETIPGSTSLGYGYFNDGELRILVSGTNAWTYSWNRRRLPLTEQLSIDGRVKIISHGYDVLGHQNSLTYPSGLTIATAPNALGQPTQVAGATSYAAAIGYFPNGGMSGFTYGNGIVHTLTQNTRELPLRSLDVKPGAAEILDDTYTYDPNGNVTGIADGTGNNADSRTMGYDWLDRLTGTAAAGQPWTSASTTYDPLDNIRTNAVGNRTYTYAYDPTTWRLSQLGSTTAAPMALTYDANGNVASKGAGFDSYTFDIANRMQSVTGKESYVYDGYGRRVKVTTTGSVNNGKIDYPIYTMGGQLLTEDDQRANTTTDYISLNGSLVAKNVATLGTTSYAPTYEHTDALRSPVTETSSAGLVTHAERYTPYGEPGDHVYTQGPGFTSHVTDAATGLTYAQQRFYDPVLGRFLSVDPIGAQDNGASFNRYWYANNNPYKFSDADGRTAWSTFLGIVSDALDTGAQMLMNAPPEPAMVAAPEMEAASVALRADATAARVEAGEVSAVAHQAPEIPLPSPAVAQATISGNAQVTRVAGQETAHAATSARIAAEEATRADAKSVHLNQTISTATKGEVKSSLRPDVQTVRTDGKVDAQEVLSPGQDAKASAAKYNNALGDKAGTIKCVPQDKCG